MPLDSDLQRSLARVLPPNNTKDTSLSEEALDHLSDLLMVQFKALFRYENG